MSLYDNFCHLKPQEFNPKLLIYIEFPGWHESCIILYMKLSDLTSPQLERMRQGYIRKIKRCENDVDRIGLHRDMIAALRVTESEIDRREKA